MDVRVLLLTVLTLAWTPTFAGNVVFFLGDGMGISTITAARIYAGQQLGKPGEEHDLAFDKFDNVALIKTYNVDAQVSDSAGTITAIMTGQKTRIGVVGVDATVDRDDCPAALENYLSGKVKPYPQEDIKGKLYRKADFSPLALRKVLDYVGEGLTYKEINRIKFLR